MIIIAGVINIDPDKRAACLAASEPLQLATRRDEPGCHAYVFSADPCEPGHIAVYELWDDAETLQAHFVHENYTNMRTMFGQHGITGSTVRKYRTDADAPVYNEQRIATATFD
ncbi:MAG: antibiotic biosynthesis monooxygenase [Actinomycetota bacterium]|jgi:quinol monooxygenase YgiN